MENYLIQRKIKLTGVEEGPNSHDQCSEVTPKEPVTSPPLPQVVREARRARLYQHSSYLTQNAPV